MLIRIFLAVFVIISVLRIIFPEYSWWIEHGMPKDAEPSDGGVLAVRVGGAVGVIAGVIFFIMTL